MIKLQDVTYLHHNRDLLFEGINLIVSKNDKVALIGNNGTGKSTLLKLIAGELQPSGGYLTVGAKPYYVPQIFRQYNSLTISQALRIEGKLNALNEILDGKVTENNLQLLDDDWTIEDRCKEALRYWQLTSLDLTQKIQKLSGGEKAKVFLPGISIHQPELILLDEPSNHLDAKGRQLLRDFVQADTSTFVIVSHDRKLLNLLHTICEMSKHGISVYGGNYNFYAEQKQIENNALNQDLKGKEKALRKAKEKERETLERQQKLIHGEKRNKRNPGVKDHDEHVAKQCRE